MFNNQLSIINDSNDIKHKSHLTNLLVSNQFYDNNLSTNNNLITSTSMLPITTLNKTIQSINLNYDTTPIKTLLKGENTSILAADQSIRNYKNLMLNNSDYNLSTSNNIIDSFITVNRNLTSLQTELPAGSLLTDTQSFSKL